MQNANRRVIHKFNRRNVVKKNRVKKTRGEWTPGKVVKVGSLTLIVEERIETQAGEPDAYQLGSFDRTRHYQFQAFRGLRRVA
jgi:hypothetical protein